MSRFQHNLYVCIRLCMLVMIYLYFFFFKQKTAYEMRISDWSSDVCSSDLLSPAGLTPIHTGVVPALVAGTQFPSRLVDRRGLPTLDCRARSAEFSRREATPS